MRCRVCYYDGTYEEDVVSPLGDAVGRAREIISRPVGKRIDERAVNV